MTWIFRHIENTEYELLDLAFKWYKFAPKILKSNWELENDKEVFLADLKNGMNFVGFVGDIPCGIVHGNPTSKDIIEGHLFCGKNTDVDFLTSLIIYSKREALKKFKNVITSTISKHTTMLEINERAGFIDTGIRSWNSVYRGQLIETQYNIAQ